MQLILMLLGPGRKCLRISLNHDNFAYGMRSEDYRPEINLILQHIRTSILRYNVSSRDETHVLNLYNNFRMKLMKQNAKFSYSQRSIVYLPSHK